MSIKDLWRWRQPATPPSMLAGWQAGCPDTRSDVEGVESVHEVVEVVLRLLRLVRLALRNADRQADGVATIPDKFTVAFPAREVEGVAAADRRPVRPAWGGMLQNPPPRCAKIK